MRKKFKNKIKILRIHSNVVLWIYLMTLCPTFIHLVFPYLPASLYLILYMEETKEQKWDNKFWQHFSFPSAKQG